MYDYRARLVRLIDADTFVLDIDLGFYVHTEQHVRLAGIDCPESRTPEGKLATEFTRGWWDVRDGKALVFTTKKFTRSLERFVAEVRDDEDEHGWLASALRDAGHFKPVERLG